MEDLKKEIGQRLKTARFRKGMRQNRAADALGIHNSTLGKYESGEREADNETLTKMADLYEVKVQWIITGQKETPIKEESIDPERALLIEIVKKLPDEELGVFSAIAKKFIKDK
ncbi:XRE family transcriptional regulator [Paenibacillaceae bacterium]|nr:XRE family transcriptional regulator [Paenibacillaceae bacterium]